MYRERAFHSPKLDEEVEERLRPNRFLGYDRDHLGIALLRREMFDAAESQFRRAVYLNPYEAGFKQHLAWCLHRENRDAEALAVIEEAIRLNPQDPDARVVRDRILESIRSPQGPVRDGSIPHRSA